MVDISCQNEKNGYVINYIICKKQSDCQEDGLGLARACSLFMCLLGLVYIRGGEINKWCNTNNEIKYSRDKLTIIRCYYINDMHYITSTYIVTSKEVYVNQNMASIILYEFNVRFLLDKAKSKWEPDTNTIVCFRITQTPWVNRRTLLKLLNVIRQYLWTWTYDIRHSVTTFWTT